jgi:hypothetical protein
VLYVCVDRRAQQLVVQRAQARVQRVLLARSVSHDLASAMVCHGALRAVAMNEDVAEVRPDVHASYAGALSIVRLQQASQTLFKLCQP